MSYTIKTDPAINLDSFNLELLFHKLVFGSYSVQIPIKISSKSQLINEDIKTSNEFHRLAEEDGTVSPESALYIRSTIRNYIISYCSLYSKIKITLGYFQYMRNQEREEFKTEYEYNDFYLERLLKRTIDQDLPIEIEEFLYNLCINYSSEFSSSEGVTNWNIISEMERLYLKKYFS